MNDASIGKTELVTIKVTKKAASNIRVAAALSGRTQYEMSEEGSFYVVGKYSSKSKRKSTNKEIKR